VEAQRRAMKRWVVFAITWQALVIAGCFVYAFVMTHTYRAGGLALIAPPLAALLGTALPYQLAVSRLFRAVRR
jgi:hypothetical protein